MLSHTLRFSIASDVKQIVQVGLLDESCNPQLVQETVLALVRSYSQIFDPNRRPNDSSPRYPIEFENLLRAVKSELLRRYFMDERIDNKRRLGLIEEEWEGSIVSFDSTPTWEDMEWVEKQVAHAMDDGLGGFRTSRYSELAKIEKRLEAAQEILERNGSSIEGPLFPLQEKLEEAFQRGYPISPDDMWLHVRRLFELFFENYAALVERNFPTLKRHFKLYSQMPLTLFVIPEPRDWKIKLEPGITFVMCRAPRGSARNEIIRREKRDMELPRGGVTHDGRTYEWLWSGGGGPIINFLRTSHAFLDVKTRGGFSPILREKVYSQIQKELGSALEGLMERYDLS
jgi:hypothetical protein